MVVQFFDHVFVPSDKKHNDGDEENIEGSQCDHDWVLPVDEEHLLEAGAKSVCQKNKE